MKVLFLDIDGVLNSVQMACYYNRKNRNNSKMEWNPYHEFCPISVSNLVELLEEFPDLKICISSTWRKGCKTIKDLQELFDAIPLEDGREVIQSRIIGRTPAFGWALDGRRDSCPRGLEIQDWLDKQENLTPVTKFAIIDDDSDMVHLKYRLFKTDNRMGLMWNVLEELKSYFRS